MPLQIPPRRAIIVGLLLLAGPAAAQGPPVTYPHVTYPHVTYPHVTYPPPRLHVFGTPSAPAVDPQVTVLFGQAIAAHQALKALSATVAMSSTDTGPTVNQTVTLAYQKPNRVKTTVSNSSGLLVQIYAGPKTITLYDVKNRTYRVQPVPPGADPVLLALRQAPSLLVFLMSHPEALNTLLTQHGVTVKVGASSPYAFADVDTVVATMPQPGGSKVATLDIGKADHLLRQITLSGSQTAPSQSQKVLLTETVTALSVNPALTAADFVFTPSLGVRKIVAPKASENPPMHDPRLVPGARPFPVAAKDLSGRPLTLAQYQGKVVLMDFWATWCGPCVGEMPNVVAAYKKYHTQGFDIVGVSLDQSRPALTSFIAENKMPWRQVFDGKYWSSTVPREYGVQSIPFGLLVGRDGKIAAVDVRGPALETAIQQALAK